MLWGIHRLWCSFNESFLLRHARGQDIHTSVSYMYIIAFHLLRFCCHICILLRLHSVTFLLSFGVYTCFYSLTAILLGFQEGVEINAICISFVNYLFMSFV